MVAEYEKSRNDMANDRILGGTIGLCAGTLLAIPLGIVAYNHGLAHNPDMAVVFGGLAGTAVGASISFGRERVVNYRARRAHERRELEYQPESTI